MTTATLRRPYVGYGTRLLGSGLYHVGETSWLWVPYGWTAGGRGVIYCHGDGQTAASPVDPAVAPGTFAIIAALAARWPVLLTDLGGLHLWGNPTVVSRIADAKTYLQATVGADAGKVFLVGTSAGALAALNYAGNHLSDVQAVVGIGPVCDLTDLHDNNRGNYAGSIDTAYGGYSEAVYGATSNPTTMAAHSVYGSLPIKLWNGSTDTVAVPSTVTGFAATVGASASTVQVTGGHAESTWANVPSSDVVAFLALNES